MSNNTKYIITTLNDNIQQRNKPGGESGSDAGVMPFLFSSPGVISLRDTNLPYISGDRGALDVYDWKVVSGSADSGGGGGIPESITAGENLVHWYKMNEGSTIAVTDVGLSASSTDMTLAGGVTADETGPSAIGSPDAIKFDGTDGIGSAYVRSDGSNTALGTLFDSDTWSVSWWMKDTESSYPNNDWHHWIGCADSTSWYWPRAWGLRYYFAQFAAWGYAGGAVNVYSNIGAFSGASSWRNYVMTFNSSAGEFEGWINGTKNLTVSGLTIDTSVGSETNMFLSIGGLKHPNGGVGQWTAPYFSDLRFYDIALSDANIASIYAGDWT